MLKRRKEKRAALRAAADEAQPERRLVNMDTYSVLDDHLDPETEMAAWFCSGMSRSEVTHMAMSILEKGEAGEFIIRDKKGEPNCYGISIKSPNRLRKEFLSYILEKSPDERRPGYVVRGAEALVFDSISKLVQHFMGAKRDELGVRLVEPGDYLSSFESMFGNHKKVTSIAETEEAGSAGEDSDDEAAPPREPAPAEPQDAIPKDVQVPPPDRTLGNTYFPSSEAAAAAIEYDGFGSDLDDDDADAATDAHRPKHAVIKPTGYLKRELRAVFDDLPEDDDDVDTEFGFGDDDSDDDDDDFS